MTIVEGEIEVTGSLPSVAQRTAAGDGLHVAGVAKAYRGQVRPALDGVDVEVDAGEFTVVLGPSGCGKTTLLRILAGLLRADAGTVRVGEEVWVDAARRRMVPPERRNLGLVFQNYALWPHLTVAKNVSFPLESQRRRFPASSRARLVREKLELVRCGDLADRYPSQLSGGQQQRVALARALVSEPQLLLLDEPLSNLDARLRIDLRDEIKRLHRELGFTALMVTHDQDEALALGTQIVVMRDGRVEQTGGPDSVLERPSSPYVADFFGYTNRIDGSLAATARSVAGVGPDAVAYVRPTDLCLDPIGSAALTGSLSLGSGVVDVVARGVSSFEYRVVTPDGSTLLARGDGRSGEALAPGTEVEVRVRGRCVRWYDAAGHPVGGEP